MSFTISFCNNTGKELHLLPVFFPLDVFRPFPFFCTFKYPITARTLRCQTQPDTQSALMKERAVHSSHLLLICSACAQPGALHCILQADGGCLSKRDWGASTTVNLSPAQRLSFILFFPPPSSYCLFPRRWLHGAQTRSRSAFTTHVTRVSVRLLYNRANDGRTVGPKSIRAP